MLFRYLKKGVQRKRLQREIPNRFYLLLEHVVKVVKCPLFRLKSRNVMAPKKILLVQKSF